MGDKTAALLAPAGFVFVHDKAVHANTQIGSQTTFVRLEFVEQLPFEKLRKKSLRKILRIVGGPVPSPADVFVDRLPVRRTQCFERMRALLGINAAGRLDYRAARQRKAISARLKIILLHRPGLPKLCPVLLKESKQEGRS